MKYKKSILALFGLFTVLGVVGFAQIQNISTSDLILKIDSPKNVYKLGEPINFSFELQNKSNELITLLNSFSTSDGYIHVKVSTNGSSFIASDDPSWGLDDSENMTYVGANGSTKANGKVLWGVSSQKTAVFQFDKPGVYYFKAYYKAKIKDANSLVDLESEPLQITIEEPVGDDLKVWNRIKANGEFAYFIQNGDIRIPSYKAEERAKFVQQVEQILSEYPNSFYSDSLRQSLTNAITIENKNKENMRKLQKQ